MYQYYRPGGEETFLPDAKAEPATYDHDIISGAGEFKKTEGDFDDLDEKVLAAAD
jgi:hypothetical protein